MGDPDACRTCRPSQQQPRSQRPGHMDGKKEKTQRDPAKDGGACHGEDKGGAGVVAEEEEGLGFL